MTGFELYVFFLCMLVFVALTALFSFLIFYIGKQKALLITHGLEDGRIKKTITKKLNKETGKTGKFFALAEKVISAVICIGLCVLFLATGISGCRGDQAVSFFPAIKVVASTSMAERYENNKYLFENDLTDQLQLFDVVLLHPLPPEEELELYSIVVYEHISGPLLMHRIVGIEPPNQQHPDEYHFLLQGDAVHYPDTFPVRYSQMKSLYRGEKIPNVGSFVYFMQSPAGMICLILVLVSLILMPIADRILLRKEYARVQTLVEQGELDASALRCYPECLEKRRRERVKGGDRHG